jgi:hypothetical protein
MKLYLKINLAILMLCVLINIADVRQRLKVEYDCAVRGRVMIELGQNIPKLAWLTWTCTFAWCCTYCTNLRKGPTRR